MRLKKAWAFFFCLLITGLSFGSTTDYKKFRISIYPSLSLGSFNTEFSNFYIPDLFSALPGTAASQVLSLQGAADAGIAFGFCYYLNESLGIRIAVGRLNSGINGEKSAYEVVLKYISRPPPSYEPREFTYDGSREWVPTEGKLKIMSATCGIELRHSFSSHFQGAGTLGAGLYRVWGEFGPLGYTNFWLGGHSVLYVEDYLVFLKVPAGLKPGLNFGAELMILVGNGVFLSLRGGYDLIGKITTVPVVDRVLNYTYLNKALPEEFSKIMAKLSLQELRISPSTYSLGIGLGVGF